MSERSRVRIIYKSGAQIDVECDQCNVSKVGPDLSRIALDGADPRPLFFGIEDIAAVWDLGSVEQ